jgi:hypothetical protein
MLSVLLALQQGNAPGPGGPAGSQGDPAGYAPLPFLGDVWRPDDTV